MRKKFDVRWSEESRLQLNKIVSYLKENWTEKEALNFIVKLKQFEKVVSRFPESYAASGVKPDLRRAVISRHQSVIYQIDEKASLIRVFTILDNRQRP